MRRVLVVVLAFVSLAGVAACGDDDSDLAGAAGPPFEVSETTISHATTQEISVWAPTAQGSWPIATLSHGMGGTRENMAEMASRLAEEGLVVFAIEYQSTLGAPPDIVQIEQDAECGYRYSLSVAEDYGGDPALPITFVGFSFGATVALAGGLNEVYEPNGGYDRCFSGVARADVIVGLAGCYLETPEGFATGFDPASTDSWTNTEPEIVLVGGSDDEECEAWQSEDAAELFSSAGYNARYEQVEDANHFQVVFHDIIDGEYVAVPDAPAGEQAAQIILDAIPAE